MIQTIVERIYIVDKDDERFCHIFIKGCTDEDYTGFFQTAGYIEQKTTTVCDSEQYCRIDNLNHIDFKRTHCHDSRRNARRTARNQRRNG